MSAPSMDEPAAPIAKPIATDSTNGSDHSTKVEGSEHSSSTAERQKFASHLRPLQIKKTLSVKWVDEVTEETNVGDKLPTTPYPNHLSSKSERIIASKIEQLSQLESPQLRELVKRLGNLYRIETPRSSDKKFPHPYAEIKVGERWEEIQGGNRWAGLLEPIDPVLRAEIVRYGEFAQAAYDAFDGDTDSKYCGSSKHTKNVLLEKAGLGNRGYEITDFLYTTSQIDLPNFFSNSAADDSWSKESNWMGYVAVCTSPKEIARLGRRDIVVVWRGTITKLEWISDVQDYLAPAGFDPRGGNENVAVESGFLSVYKSSNENSQYNKTSAREQVLGAVKRLVEKYKHQGKLSITVVGHSLGSALATLCGYDLAESQMNRLSGDSPVPKEWNSQKPSDLSNSQHAKEEKHTLKELLQAASGSKSKFLSDRIPITVFSFAGPKVGNRSFKDRVEALGVAVLRVVNKNDLVPKVPGVIFQHGLAVLQKVVTFLPAYKHVGEKLTIDNFLSNYLVKTANIADFHNLEQYLHVVDGYHGNDLPFKPTLRDYSLVNKGTDLLKKEYYIPASWWQEAHKGIVQDKEGHWVVPDREVELQPKMPGVQPTEANEEDIETNKFLRSVSIAAQRAQERSGEGQVALAPAPAHVQTRERHSKETEGISKEPKEEPLVLAALPDKQRQHHSHSFAESLKFLEKLKARTS